MKPNNETREQKVAFWRKVLVASGIVSLVVWVPMAFNLAAGVDLTTALQHSLGLPKALLMPVGVIAALVLFGAPVLFSLALYRCFFQYRMDELTKRQQAVASEQERVALARMKRSLYARGLVLAFGIIFVLFILVVAGAVSNDIKAGEEVSVGVLAFGVIAAAAVVVPVALFAFRRVARVYYDPKDGSYQVAAPTEVDIYDKLAGGEGIRRKLDEGEKRRGIERGTSMRRRVLSVVLKALGVLLAIVAIIVGIGAIASGDGGAYRAIILVFVASALINSDRILGLKEKPGSGNDRQGPDGNPGA
jgi:hypothetical protein